jgi:HlyD family type I secretion membrane fusion protein
MTAVAESMQAESRRDPAADREKLADQLAAPAMRSVRFSGAIAAGLFALVFGLSAFVPIASGTLAAGQLAVEGERKVVQHASGGIVSAILVKEGDTVVEGQTVLRLDAVQADSAAGVVNSQVDSLRAEEAVRLAETMGHRSVAFPKELMDRANEPRVASLLGSERAAFEARRALAASQIQQMDTQLSQVSANIVSSQSDRNSQAAQLVLLQEERDALKPLLEKGLALKSRVLALERSVEEAKGRIASLDAEIVRLNARLAETRSLKARVEIDRRAEAADVLRTVRGNLAGAVDRQRGTDDTLDRTEIKAPTSGVVMALRVATVGGVIEAGQPVMEIVPQRKGLIARARVRPSDADNVRVGLAATIRLDAARHRSPPRIKGVVESISADALSDSRTGESYFEARVAMRPEEVEKVPPELIAPGLPAEVLIETGSHTILQYLFSPVESAMFRTMRDQ